MCDRGTGQQYLVVLGPQSGQVHQYELGLTGLGLNQSDEGHRPDIVEINVGG